MALSKRTREELHYPINVALLFIGFYIGQQFFNLSGQSTFFMFLFWWGVLRIADEISERIMGLKK